MAFALSSYFWLLILEADWEFHSHIPHIILLGRVFQKTLPHPNPLPFPQFIIFSNKTNIFWYKKFWRFGYIITIQILGITLDVFQVVPLVGDANADHLAEVGDDVLFHCGWNIYLSTLFWRALMVLGSFWYTLPFR